MIRTSEKQEAAEATIESFKQHRGPFVVAAETTRMAMIFTDAKAPDNPIIFANDSFLALSGYSREEVLGQSFSVLMANGADPVALAQIENAFAGTSEENQEACFRRKDASVFWSAILISPVRDEAGEIVQHFASFVDLTKHIDEQIQSKLLIAELNHRVKNTLATVQSIVRQALRTANDPEVIRESIESRLFALSLSHDLLSSESWKGAELVDVINQALEPFGRTDERAERIVLVGQSVWLTPKAALALGIAFHELATNAAKYGAFSNQAGSIALTWAIKPDDKMDRLILLWQEKDGPPVKPPAQKGFGSWVLERGLAHELEGTVSLEYPKDGLTCEIVFPLPSASHE